MKQNMIIIGILALIIVGGCVDPKTQPNMNDNEEKPTDFLECEKLGGNVAESYPRQCFWNDLSFVEEIDETKMLPDDTNKEACSSLDGKWIEEAEECEGISKDSCEDLGGEFQECASACRNDPEAQICTMQCVIVCDFKTAAEEISETQTCTEEQIQNQMCTREYMPVCGNDGMTYSNKCTACSSGNIESWKTGEC